METPVHEGVETHLELGIMGPAGLGLLARLVVDDANFAGGGDVDSVDEASHRYAVG